MISSTVEHLAYNERVKGSNPLSLKKTRTMTRVIVRLLVRYF